MGCLLKTGFVGESQGVVKVVILIAVVVDSKYNVKTDLCTEKA